MVLKHVCWNGFLSKCVQDYPKEAAGLIYSRGAYTDEEMWQVIPMENMSKTPETHFKLNPKEFRQMGKNARILSWNYIGIVHSHPWPKNAAFNEELLQRLLLPSKKDIKNATIRDLMVTGIIVCNNKAVYDIRFHTPFGMGKVDIMVNEIPIEKEYKINGCNHEQHQT